MRINFKYRIFPSKTQIKQLNKTLEGCRVLYNKLLEQRRDSWEISKVSIGLYDQTKFITKYKKETDVLNGIHSQVLQNVAVRVDLAFQSFFRRCKNGETPGYPRFKGFNHYSSICYPQYSSSCKLIDNHIKLSKIGNVFVKLQRPIEGKPKTVTIQKTRTNKWFIIISCELTDVSVKQPVRKAIGVDVGIESFATLSDGSKIPNPRFYERDQKQLAKAQQNKRYEVAAKIHERIVNRRHNFIHQQSTNLVNHYDLIIAEDLDINRLKEKHWCSKQISDAGWGTFLNMVAYKAENAGKQFVKVNPAYTSQDCSRCGHRESKKLADRQHNCKCCGLTMHRDENAARNILAVGLHGLGITLEAPVL